MAAAAVYNYNETSETTLLTKGFRNTDKDFVIAGLFPVHSHNLSGLGNLELLEAMLFAIDRINHDLNLLPNLTIGYDVRDSNNDAITGFLGALDISIFHDENQYIDTPLLGIVGPAYTSVTHPVATLLSLEIIQTPLISYASSDAILSNKDFYKYLLRTIPSDNLQANAMVDLVSNFGWEQVVVIFNDNDYGVSVSNAFIDSAMNHDICVEVKIRIPLSNMLGTNKAVKDAVKALLKSTASIVVVFTDEHTVLTLFEEVNSTNSLRKFVWIASNRWANSDLIRDKFPEITKGMYGFQLHIDHVKEFDDYFSQLTPSTNIRNPFFQDYCRYHYETSVSGYDCPDDLTTELSYTQVETVPFVINAVYAFAHALQNFLDNNCDKPLRWDCATRQCDGMKNTLTGENLLGYLLNVSFSDMQNRTMSFDEYGNPPGVYAISSLQVNESGQYEYISVGYWYSADKKNFLVLNNTDRVKKITSRCSEPCSDGMIRSINNTICASCFECIPCVGPKYSANSSDTECIICPNNHWGNNPLLGSTHCVAIKMQHAEFSNGWSIVSMSIATIALIILAIIVIIFVINWKTPVVKSSDREQTIMLLVGIGTACVLIYVVVAPPSNVVCSFQRIGVWLCFSLAFGALLIKIVRIAGIFYSIESSTKKPSFSNTKYQVMFTMAIVFVQLILVVIGLIIDPPVVKRDPDKVVTTSVQPIGNAPEIIEICQPSHIAILSLSLAYNSIIIVGCIILGWMTRKFPQNFNEAEHVMFTSFTIMVVWVLFIPLYLHTNREIQIGVLALGIVLSALALMAGVFFPRVYIIIFQKHKNTVEYINYQNHLYAARSTKTFQQSKIHIHVII